MTDQTSFEAAAFTGLGTARERVALPTDTFDGTVHMPAMHLAVKAYLANQRQGTAYTKTRGLVIGGNQKPWKQKGTGRARQGSTRAPHWPGGGTVFGPHGDRNYEQDLPRKVKQLARKSAFNARARENAILVIDGLNYSEPRTKALLALIERTGSAGRKVLVLTDGYKPNVYLSGRNLARVHVLPFKDASTYHILWSDVVLIDGPALGYQLEPVAEKAAAPAPRSRAANATPAPRKAAARKTAAKAETTDKKPAARKTARKKED